MDLEAELIFTRGGDLGELNGAQSVVSAPSSEDFLTVDIANPFAKEDERVPRRFSQQKRVLR